MRFHNYNLYLQWYNIITYQANDPTAKNLKNYKISYFMYTDDVKVLSKKENEFDILIRTIRLCKK